MIFKALIISPPIPLWPRGLGYRPIGASALLRRSIWTYGSGGPIAPLAGIESFDLIVPGPLGA